MAQRYGSSDCRMDYSNSPKRLAGSMRQSISFHDRDQPYGDVFTRRVRSMGIREQPTAPRSPRQNGHAERLIASIRRECLDHVVVFGERHLRHLLRSYMQYYNDARTHLSLSKDAPEDLPRRCSARPVATILCNHSPRQGRCEKGHAMARHILAERQMTKPSTPAHAISTNRQSAWLAGKAT